MKPKLTKYLSIALAGLLQIVPLIRSALPSVLTAARSPLGAIIARWAVGGAAYFGYHAISGATSLNYAISISPPTATQGKYYSGTLTWSGGYAASARSMSINGNCIVGSPYQISPGLFIQYNSVNTATISGIPTSTNLITMSSEIYETTGCAATQFSAVRTSPTFSVISTNGVTNAPSFNNYPQNQLAVAGQAVELFGSASGNPVPTYQWGQNLVPISGATNANFTIASAQPSNAGTYSLTASNSAGRQTAYAVLSVCQLPGTNFGVLFWTNYVVAGTPLTLTSSITNTSTATNTYQWFINNSQVPPANGGTNQNLTLLASQTTPAKSGTYSISFTSQYGSTYYAYQVEFDTQWQFGYLPNISVQPLPQTVAPGSTATFTCTIMGSTFPTVLLYQNATNLVAQYTNLSLTYNPGGTGQPGNGSTTTNVSLSIPNVTAVNAGTYTMVVTNFWGATTSSPVALTVTSPLSVSSPVGVTNYSGKNVSLSVTASGSAPLSYQWQKGGVNLSNGGAISGVNTNTLLISPATPANNGNYQIVVTNSSGSVTSSVAAVSILPLPSFGLSLGSNNAILSATGGVPGSNYVLQVSTNLANANGWMPVLTNTVPANGAISVTNTNLPATGPRFYRVQFP